MEFRMKFIQSLTQNLISEMYKQRFALQKYFEGGWLVYLFEGPDFVNARSRGTWRGHSLTRFPPYLSVYHSTMLLNSRISFLYGWNIVYFKIDHDDVADVIRIRLWFSTRRKKKQSEKRGV